MGDGPQARRHRNKGTMKEDKELHERSFTEATAAIQTVMAMDFSTRPLPEVEDFRKHQNAKESSQNCSQQSAFSRHHVHFHRHLISVTTSFLFFVCFFLFQRSPGGHIVNPKKSC